MGLAADLAIGLMKQLIDPLGLSPYLFSFIIIVTFAYYIIYNAKVEPRMRKGAGLLAFIIIALVIITASGGI